MKLEVNLELLFTNNKIFIFPEMKNLSSLLFYFMIALVFEGCDCIRNPYVFILSHFPIRKKFISGIYVEKRQNTIYILKDTVNLNITGKTFNHTIVNLFKPKVDNISI